MTLNELPTIELSRQAQDLTNKRQGKLVFVKPAERINKRIYWWVLCDCGTIEKVRADCTKTCCQQCNNKIKSEKLLGKNMQDLTNQHFGQLIALYPLPERKNKHIYWHCKCNCGNEVDVISTSLTSGNTKSCGCQRKDHAYFKTLKENLVGQRFGYLTVLEETDQRQYQKVVWKCQCDCGNIVYLNTGRLKSGNDTSCGCKKTSLGAIYIEKILKENNIFYKKEYTEPELKNKRYDFVIFDSNNKIIRFIEFDGEQHFKTTGGWNNEKNLKIIQQRDREKNEYALSHNIPLVRIPYWERNNITLEMLMGDQYLVHNNIH